MNSKELNDILYKNQDLKYKEFNDKIINTKLKTIGVRTPVLKKIAKEISKGDYEYFLKQVNNYSYEEIMIEGFVISMIKDPIVLLRKLDSFLDKIDNWATCDLILSSCKGLIRIEDDFLDFIIKNLESKNKWRKRAGYVSLIYYFVDEKYLDFIFKAIDKENDDFYYCMMARSWLISECYIKYPKATIKYLKNTTIDDKTYNKAIDKICDSKRVSKTDKEKLKMMKKRKDNA